MASVHAPLTDHPSHARRSPRRPAAAPGMPAAPSAIPSTTPAAIPSSSPVVPVGPSGSTPEPGGTAPALWPRLDQLGLSADALAMRRETIGGSDANVILSGSDERVLRLWQEKRGELEPEDLSGRLPVMLGCWSEEFNRQWYAARSGHGVTQVGASVTCAVHPWRSATLDGFVDALGAVFEAKHTSAFVKGEELLARYMPQLQHTMDVLQASRAVLSVIYGNGKWECYEVAADWLYQADLLEAELWFRECVESGVAPVAAAVPPAPKAIGVREVCLEGNNHWASSAADWLQHRLAAKRHAEATSSLKSLVEDDVARAFGHGIEVKRSKAGALTIRELSRNVAGNSIISDPRA